MVPPMRMFQKGSLNQKLQTSVRMSHMASITSSHENTIASGFSRMVDSQQAWESDGP